MFELEHMERLEAAGRALLDADSLIITCHVRPDGDALGSMLGMAGLLEAMGKSVVCYCQDEPPQSLGFLPGFDRIIHELPDPFPLHATLLVLDCSEAPRIGEQGAVLVESSAGLVVLDHHLGQDMCGEYHQGETGSIPCVQYINPDIFATGAICFALAEKMGWEVTPDIAVNFYSAILTDTGCFRHSNTTSLAFAMAARLVEYGADPYEISDRLFERVPFRKLALLNMALDNLAVCLEGRAAMLHVTTDMLEECGCTLRDCDDFVRYARCIDGVEVSAFIKEINRELVSVSLRSRSWFNVAELAKKFGGGGHFHAAGFRAEGSASEWRASLEKILRPRFENHAQESKGVLEK